MEPAPLKEDLNSKEYYNKPSQTNKPNNDIFNVNDFFIEENKQNLDTVNNNKNITSLGDDKFIIPFSYYPLSSIIISLSILLFTISLFFFLKELEIYQRILIPIAGIIITLIIFIFTNNRLEIIKNDSDNKVIIKIINLLCFAKKKIILYRENTHFYTKLESDRDDNFSIKLIIINDYHNLIDIDLDTSNIKHKPAKFYYFFDHIGTTRNYSYNTFAEELNKFIGSDENNKNPLISQIESYIKNNPNILNEYMKFSDNYSTVNILYPSFCFYRCKTICFIFFNVAAISIAIPFLVISNFKTHIRIAGIIIVPLTNIIIYIFFKCIEIFKYNILRIDFIYSKNFDRIFIGLVKYNETSYVRTFEFQMNNIEKFILKQKSQEDFILTAIFKNNETQQIYNIKNIIRYKLEGLIYFLNEKLIKNKSNNINNSNNSNNINNSNNMNNMITICD